MDIWNEGIAYKKGAAFLGAGFTIKPLNEDYIGVLRAIDPVTGKEVWRHKNYAPLWGGVLTTKGNLVFTGTPEGFLQAFNAKTGEKVWEFQTGSGVLGSPVTWEMDGEQYVSVLSAGAARCRCGVAKWPSASRTSTRAACSGPSSCRRIWWPSTDCHPPHMPSATSRPACS
jgi:outer membrane protein assembly factor BamB